MGIKAKIFAHLPRIITKFTTLIPIFRANLVDTLNATKALCAELRQIPQTTAEIENKIRGLEEAIALIDAGKNKDGILRAIAIGDEPPTLVICENIRVAEIKIAYFLKLKAGILELVKRLDKEMGVVFDEDLVTLFLEQIHSSLAQAKMHYVFHSAGKTKRYSEFQDLITELQNNPGNVEALSTLKKHYSDSTCFAEFEINGEPASHEAAAALLNNDNDHHLNDKTTFTQQSCTEFVSSPEGNDPKLSAKIITSKQDFLSACPLQVREMLVDVDELTEKQSALEVHRQTKIIKLQTAIIAEISENLGRLRKMAEKIENRLNIINKLLARLEAVEDALVRGDMEIFLRQFDEESMLALFCETAQLSHDDKNNLLADWQNQQRKWQDRWYKYVCNLWQNRGYYKTKNLIELHKQINKINNVCATQQFTQSVKLEKARGAIALATELQTTCQRSLMALTRALSQFDMKDKPFWWREKTFRELITQRDRLVELLRQTKENPQEQPDNQCAIKACVDFKKEHLSWSLFGDYHKKRMAFAASLEHRVEHLAASAA